MADVASGPASRVAISPKRLLAVAANGNVLSSISLSPDINVPMDTISFHSLRHAGRKSLTLQAISSLCFPGEATVYAASSTGAFYRCQVGNDAEPSVVYSVKDPHGHNGEVTGIASVGPESIVVTCGKDTMIRCWDPETRQSVARLAGHKYEVRAVAVAESAAETETVNIIASAGRDKTVRLWDVRASETSPIHVFSGHTGWVHDVAISASGRVRPDPVVLSCAGDKTVRVWNLTMMKQELELSGHEYRVWSVSVAADGSFALSGSTDATVRAWNLAPRVEEHNRCVVLEGHRDSVLSVAVSRDGMVGISGCEDGSIFAWNTGGLFGRYPQTPEKVNTMTDSSPSVDLTEAPSIAHECAHAPDVSVDFSPDTKLAVEPAVPKLDVAGTTTYNALEELDTRNWTDISPNTSRVDIIQSTSLPTTNSYSNENPVHGQHDLTSGPASEIVKEVISQASAQVGVDESQANLERDRVTEDMNKDALIELLRSQLRAAENLARNANAEALASTLVIQEPHGNAHIQSSPLLADDATLKQLREINDRLRMLSSRLDILLVN